MNKFEVIIEKMAYPLLALAVTVSIIDVLVPDILPNAWYIIAIFSILFVLAVHTSKMPSIEKRMEYLEKAVDVVGVSKYSTQEEVYFSLRDQVRHASKELLLTHIRIRPPSHFVRGQEYYESVEKWVGDHPSGVAKRISTDTPKQMSEFVKTQAEFDEGNHNFHFRVVPWENNFPLLNIAIIDKKIVYVIISGDTAEDTSAISSTDSEVIEYYVRYFTNLWHQAKEPEVGDGA